MWAPKYARLPSLPWLVIMQLQDKSSGGFQAVGTFFALGTFYTMATVLYGSDVVPPLPTLLAAIFGGVPLN